MFGSPLGCSSTPSWNLWLSLQKQKRISKTPTKPPTPLQRPPSQYRLLKKPPPSKPLICVGSRCLPMPKTPLPKRPPLNATWPRTAFELRLHRHHPLIGVHLVTTFVFELYGQFGFGRLSTPTQSLTRSRCPIFIGARRRPCHDLFWPPKPRFTAFCFRSGTVLASSPCVD